MKMLVEIAYQEKREKQDREESEKGTPENQGSPPAHVFFIMATHSTII